MRNLVILFVLMVVFAGCSVFNKNRKPGCPVAGSSIGAEQLTDPAALRKSEKSKFKVKGKF